MTTMLLMVYLQDSVGFRLLPAVVPHSRFVPRKLHLEFLRIYFEAEPEHHVLQQFGRLPLLSRWTLLLQIVQLPLSLCSTYNLHLALPEKTTVSYTHLTLPTSDLV